MEIGNGLQFLKSCEVLVAGVGELDAIAAEPLEVGQTGEQGQGVIGDRLAADGEVRDRLHAAESAEVGLCKTVALHIDLSDDTLFFGNFGTPFTEELCIRMDDSFSSQRCDGGVLNESTAVDRKERSHGLAMNDGELHF